MLKHQGRVSHPPLGLVGTGPLVQVTLRPHPGDAARMLAQGQQVPAVVTKMMIDTGAQRTVVDNQIALQLGLVPIRFDSIVGVSQKSENRPVYRMSVSLAMLDSETGVTAEAGFNSDIVGIASPIQQAQHFGLLGRDFLVPFWFVYDGPKGEFEIQIRQPIPTGTLPAAPGATAPLNRKQRRAEEREARKAAKRDRRGG